MALGFFRKWQKTIIVIMVVLMLSFLVGGTGMRILCSPGSRDFPRGESKYGPLTQGQITWADADMRDLSMFLNLHARSIEFVQLRQNETDASMAYALLLQEARAAGHEVGDAEVDAYLASIGLKVDEAEYKKLLGRVNSRKSGTTIPRLRATLGRWMIVLRSFRAYQVSSPPSETRLRKLFRDLNERLTLRVVKVPAEKYAPGVLPPTPQQINKQFNSYRAARPGTYSKTNPFGFGYFQPARVVVSYLLVNNDVIARVTRPGDRQVREYFRNNSGDFTKEVPVAPPSGVPTTGPGATTQPKVETRTVPMGIDEAWDQVVDRLVGRATESRIEEFVQLVQTNAEAQLGSAPADAKLYEKVYDKLIDSSRAADALSKSIRADDIAALRGKTLGKAIPVLAAAAGLDAICYPWGTTGEFSISKDVRIPQSLQADGPRTLGVVLNEITRLAFTTAKEKLEAIPAAKDSATTKPVGKDTPPKAPQYPKLKWTSCRGFTKVLFPISVDKGMTLLPISTGKTEMVDIVKLSENEDIGMAQSSRRGRGQSLPQAAMEAKPLEPGQVMYAMNANAGLRRILWQVVQAQPADELKELTDAVKEDVIADCKILSGYMTPALRAAAALAEKARTVGLEAAGKAANMETTVTAPTARLTARSRQAEIRQSVMQQAFMGGLPQGMTIQEYMAQVQAYAERVAMMARPYEYSFSTIEGIDLKTPAATKLFLDRVFELVPDDIEKPIAPGPLGPVITIPMPTARAHFVVQRVGYTPAVAGDFKEIGRRKLADQDLANAAWLARAGFFSYKSTILRVGYKDRTEKKQSDQK
ncbi:MAG: hypothetical protein QGH60_20705 [Phycisphaerae bacterium]|jgi:hypothetical protein|nr:hypothetical protein [Phycisphaerae bacterium]